MEPTMRTSKKFTSDTFHELNIESSNNNHNNNNKKTHKMDSKENNIEDQDQISFGIADRIKLKRQTKLVCSLDENWNNYNRLSHLLSYGVDGVQISSEMHSEQKKELILKVNYFANENHQYIPIIYDLSYYRVYVKKIKETNEDEVKISQGEIIYVVKTRDTMFSLNLNNLKQQQKEEAEEIIDKDSKDKSISMSESNKFDLINLSMQMKVVNEEEPKKEPRAVSILTEPAINPHSFSVGMNIHINFGDVSMEVLEITDNYLKCVAKNSGSISKYSNFSVENENHFKKHMFKIYETKLVKEIEDAISHNAHYILISTIENPKHEIKQIRELLNFKEAKHIKIICSIDSPDAIYCIEEIMELVDVVFFSRNFLLIKDNLGKLCYNFKQIVNKCNYNSKINYII